MDAITRPSGLFFGVFGLVSHGMYQVLHVGGGPIVPKLMKDERSETEKKLLLERAMSQSLSRAKQYRFLK